MRALVTGAGGFIGGHLVRALLERGDKVRAVDKKPLREWYQLHETENLGYDLSQAAACHSVCNGMDRVYHLAADMGGIGFIETHKADCMLSVLIDAHMLKAARKADVERFFYASSACVYPAKAQRTNDAWPLAEPQAGPPSDPEDGYGWEKLFAERLCHHFYEDYGMEVRVCRYHNAYGPHGTWDGGREKAPAAICRKVAEAIRDDTGEIEIWGNGKQTRTFMYIDDAIRGTLLLADSSHREPLNLGSAEVINIDKLVDTVQSIAGCGKLFRTYRVHESTGVAGRSSDNYNIRKEFGWEPTFPLREGLAITYEWIAEQVNARVPA